MEVHGNHFDETPRKRPVRVEAEGLAVEKPNI
jgi:hypothetical protein